MSKKVVKPKPKQPVKWPEDGPPHFKPKEYFPLGPPEYAPYFDGKVWR